MVKDSNSFVAWLQAAPMMLVFAVFFLLPLLFVTIVSAWDYNEYEMIPAFSLRGYSDTFEGCIADLPNLCTILKTYLKTLKLCLLTWILTLLIGFTVAYFLAFHVRSKTWQCVVVFLIAFVEMILRLNQILYAPFYALFIVGPLAMLVDIWLESRHRAR